MSEIKLPLIYLSEGETYTADSDGAYIITEKHSHGDILRYVVSDIGTEDAMYILRTMDKE